MIILLQQELNLDEQLKNQKILAQETEIMDIEQMIHKVSMMQKTQKLNGHLLEDLIMILHSKQQCEKISAVRLFDQCEVKTALMALV